MKRHRMSNDYEMEHSYAMPTINDNSNSLLKKIKTLYMKKRLHDITLVVGGISYPAHRFILCLSSEVFETMLMNSTWRDCHKEVIELQEDEPCVEVFPGFLRYFYSGGIVLGQNSILPLLILADKYNVKDLIITCVDYMCNHIADAADQGQLVSWFQYILSVNQPKTINTESYCRIWQDTECVDDDKPSWNTLLRACRNYIKWNLDACSKCFNSFQCDILVGLLKQSDLVVHDEMQLFGHVVSWLNHQSTEKLTESKDPSVVKLEMSSLIHHVLSYIRYPMILPIQMAQMLMIPIVKQNKEFFINKMASAMEYNNSVTAENHIKSDHAFDCTPRLYTSERWGSPFRIRTRTINNYQSVVRDIISCGSLFEREQEPKDEIHWEVELFLKGINYDNSYLMTWRRSIEVPGMIFKKVRAIIKLKGPDETTELVKRRVRVAILVYALQNKIAHVVSVAQKFVSFDTDQKQIIIEDFMLYDAINTPVINNELVQIKDTNVSYFLSDRIPLKFHIIITPFIPGLTETHIGTRIQNVHFK